MADPMAQPDINGEIKMYQHYVRTTSRFLLSAVVASFVAAVSLISPPASADWVSSIITERPAGQAFASGLADGDGDITILSGVSTNEGFVLQGHGSAALTLTDDIGDLIDESTCSGAVLVQVNVTSFAGPVLHRASMGNSFSSSCNIQELDLPPGTTALFELHGAFDCFGNCGGSQNGKFAFQLTVE